VRQQEDHAAHRDDSLERLPDGREQHPAVEVAGHDALDLHERRQLLQNVIERGVVLATGRVLTLDPDLLPVPGHVGPPRPTGGREPEQGIGSKAPPLPTSTAASLEEVERRHILSVLAETGGVIEGPEGAPRVLDLHPNTLRSRMKKLGIGRPRHGIS
jgi:formate hydrogenlyase transcriptional activator